MCVCSSVVNDARAEPSELDPTVGYNYGEIETARHAATVGAQRATSSSIGAVFANPANVAIGDVYHLGVLAQIWPEANRQSYGIAASDSLVSRSELAAGAGATYNTQDADGIARKWTDLRVAMAYPFSDALFVGIGGRYLWLQQDGTGPLGTSLASSGLEDEQILRQWSFDAGATVKPTPALALSLVGTNLNNPDTGFMPTTIGGGLGYGVKEFGIEADLVADFTSWEDTTLRAMLAAETLIAGQYALRAGYRYDAGLEGSALGLGFGYVAREFAADLGARRTFGPEVATTLVVSFSYHLESTGFDPTSGDTF